MPGVTEELKICKTIPYALELQTISRGSTALAGLGLIFEVPRTNSDTPHSVGIQ